MKTFISMNECPFKIGDRVQCLYTNVSATVWAIDDEHVFCWSDTDIRFYRTWSHENGGLKVIL